MSGDKARIAVQMPYIGKCLSVNHYKPDGRHTLPEAKEWMGVLRILVDYKLHKHEWQVKLPVTIYLHGKFKDGRSVTDLSNLHKVIGDSLKKSDRFPDDKEFNFSDEGYEVGCSDPVLIIGIEVEREHA